MRPLGEEHNDHIRIGGSMAIGFSYNELFKYKRRLKDELLCSQCERHLMRTAAYFKMHVAEYPHSKKFCMRLMKSYLTLEGQEEYESYPEDRATIYDRKVTKRPIDDCKGIELYNLESECLDKQGRKLLSRHLPNINAFPDFDLKKESKMWLCDLDSPTPEKVEKVKQAVLNVVREFGPQQLFEPCAESVQSLGPQLYSDGHVPRRDYEKPQHDWSTSWDYQKFKTDVRTVREVWLPPKAYKMTSSWWHFFAEPIIEKVPWLIGNDNITDVRKDLRKRFEPCTKIDLKGFGLQFPREYIHACMEAILEVYPSEEGRQYHETFKSMCRKLSVMMPDGHFITPNRGVGLGYFSNLMTLVVGSLLSEFDIVKMFNDDILAPNRTQEEAIRKLIEYDFVINEKKTGKQYERAPFFAGVCMDVKGSVFNYEVQGVKVAIFKQRFHHERKSIFASCKWESMFKACYHYERIFGYEIFKGESLKHPEMLGLNPLAQRAHGFVKGGLLRKMRQPKTEDELQRRIWSITHPWKVYKQGKSFAQERKNKRYLKDIVWYTEYDSYLNPEVKDNQLASIGKPDFWLGKYSLPKWADLQLLISQRQTVGRTTMGRHPKLAAYHMLKYNLSKDPIRTWIDGGYEVVSDFYRTPGVSELNALIYTSLKNVERLSLTCVSKKQGKGAISVLLDGTGLEFMERHGLMEKADDSDFFVFENDIDDISVYTEDSSPVDIDNDTYDVSWSSDSEGDDPSEPRDIEVNFEF